MLNIFIYPNIKEQYYAVCYYNYNLLSEEINYKLIDKNTKYNYIILNCDFGIHNYDLNVYLLNILLVKYLNLIFYVRN